ncbi:hypothetical protein [Streptomyces longhuiensis]|uniref:hypothetical protein n=1 Tax=Streptomyces TaxID=1883 RepID=UPI001D0A5A05|nr:hypothetical protein [Streptomyces longhuiensis]UDM04759.1 hypothetical protein LGI35_44335 [Streptomyces longhuiensis]
MIFFINLPVGAAALLLLARTAYSPHRPVPFDVTGQITAVIAMGVLTFEATEAGERGFTAPAVWGAALLMLAALTAPYARQGGCEPVTERQRPSAAPPFTCTICAVMYAASGDAT